MATTIEIIGMGKTRISVEPHDFVFDNGDDQVVAVDISNDVIIQAYELLVTNLIVHRKVI